MLDSLLAWLGAGPEEAFEVLCVLCGEPPPTAGEAPPGIETAGTGQGASPGAVTGVAGTTSHNELAASESPLRASWDPTGCLRLDFPTCYDRVLELASRLGFPAVAWPAREIPEVPVVNVVARSVAGESGWQAFLSEMRSLRHPKSVDSLFFAELALTRSELGLAPL